jgi:hypothetical protein
MPYKERNDIMKQRTIFRWIHIIAGIPIVGYVYSPFDQIHYYANWVRFGYVPLILLTGLWMWKGQALLRRIRRGLGKEYAANTVASTALISQP